MQKQSLSQKLQTKRVNDLKIAVIGGGASGIMAAISAARNGADVTIYERFDRIGKKILATGNGRCNLTNIYADKCNYHGLNPDFVDDVIGEFWVDKTLELFEEIGLLYKVEDEGKVYPYSNQAASVLDVLRFEIERLGVNIEFGFEVKSVQAEKSGFFVKSYDNRKSYADKVIVATGGKASPALGSNGSGYPILESFGHKLTKLNPSLVQLKLKGSELKPLNGLKLDGELTLKINGDIEKTEKGEILFTDYGISGPVVFSLSALAGRAENAIISIDMMPDYSKSDIERILKSHRDVMTNVEDLFCGVLPKRIGQVLIKNSISKKMNEDIKTVTDAEISTISQKTKAFLVEVEGTMSWNNAQVTAGGIDVRDFSSKTFESKLKKGIFATGEVLDIDGDCGGYNLQWAWSSGFVAGLSASGGVL